MEYTKRRNLNRGYMKLEVRQRGWICLRWLTDWLRLWQTSTEVAVHRCGPVGLGEHRGRLRRRSLPEYLQFLYIAKGSLAEALTRACGFWRIRLIPDAEFKAFDQLHYEVENKLLASSDQSNPSAAPATGRTPCPLIHESTHPPILSHEHSRHWSASRRHRTLCAGTLALYAQAKHNITMAVFTDGAWAICTSRRLNSPPSAGKSKRRPPLSSGMAALAGHHGRARLSERSPARDDRPAPPGRSRRFYPQSNRLPPGPSSPDATRL